MNAVHDRLIRTDAHDDGINAWRMSHVAPSTLLSGLVRGFSDYEERTGGFTQRRELPHGDGVLIFNLGDPISIIGGDGQEIRLGPGEAFVAGAHLRPAFSASTGAQRGVHVFLSLPALRRLLGVPMEELLDRVVPLDTLLGSVARDLGSALEDCATVEQRIARIEAALIARFAAMPALRDTDRHALRFIRHRPDLDLSEVARRVGWSRKHLASRTRNLIGIGPRSFRRVLRFGTAVSAASDTSRDWADIALDSGYCDQSHLIREFREFAGLSPSAFRSQLLSDGGGLVEG